MLQIDGSMGEGGGQVVRSALALSLVTGTPFEIYNIRAKRDKPGLLRQHLTAVHAAARVGRAEVEGARLRSRRLVFSPAEVVPGDYEFDVGTAGSTTLVLQTILPALLTACGPSQVVVRGGTHNPMAPPFDFLAKTFLPVISRLGPQLEATLDQPGFYPAGGGQITLRVRPVPRLASLALLDRGPITGRRVRAVVARLPEHIGQRECATIAQLSGWEASCFQHEVVPRAAGPGNAVMIELHSDQLTAVFTGFGRKGVRAERVAREVWEEAGRYLQAGVPVDQHLADQLMLPLAIAAHQGSGASAYRTLELTQHSHTHGQLIMRFLDVIVRHEAAGPDNVVVRVEPKRP